MVGAGSESGHFLPDSPKIAQEIFSESRESYGEQEILNRIPHLVKYSTDEQSLHKPCFGSIRFRCRRNPIPRSVPVHIERTHHRSECSVKQNLRVLVHRVL